MTRKKMGDLLVEAGLISIEELNRALAEQSATRMKLGDLLITKGYITEQQKIETLEAQLGIPHARLNRIKIDPKVIRLVPKRLAEKLMVLPVKIDGNRMTVAMADPLDYFAIDEIRMVTGLKIEPAVAPKDDIMRAIQRHYGIQESVDQIMRMLPVNMEEKDVDDEDAPVVRVVNQIIHAAVQQRASDIHFDPQEDSMRVRIRVDGMMRNERSFPAHMQGVIVARLKILANLNITEHRLPQDGRFEIEVDLRKIDIRISVLPTIYGEKVVLRLLDAQNVITEIDRLGFTGQSLQRFNQLISAPNGIVLISGPTGSGKTTTLYAALHRLNREEVNIVTVEDPVEYQLPGMNQVQVSPAIGLTFAAGLRAILRQDPNIIMVGEIRDGETAEIAVRAALTGHLMLSTLHTNSAASAIPRLIDMGIEPFLLASALLGVVGQRLVRTICPDCREPFEPGAEENKLFEQAGMSMDRQLYRGKGCSTCAQTGYRGRVSIQEVLVVDNDLRKMIAEKRPDIEYLQLATSRGMATMLEDGLHKVLDGITTVQEILRTTIH